MRFVKESNLQISIVLLSGIILFWILQFFLAAMNINIDFVIIIDISFSLLFGVVLGSMCEFKEFQSKVRKKNEQLEKTVMLLNSMVESGEKHSDESRSTVKQMLGKI